MRQDQFPAGADLERYRNYLRLLARGQLGSRPRPPIDPADLVQQTLPEGEHKRDPVRGATHRQPAGWLRTMLARNIADVLRAQGRLKRDVNRERSLEQELIESSAWLGAWLAAEGPSPSEFAQRHEQAIRIADALARLSPEQREALV